MTCADRCRGTRKSVGIVVSRLLNLVHEHGVVVDHSSIHRVKQKPKVMEFRTAHWVGRPPYNLQTLAWMAVSNLWATGLHEN